MLYPWIHYRRSLYSRIGADARMKILTLDIECMPNTVYVWDLRNNNYISPSQVVDYAHLACVAYKFLGEPVKFAVAPKYEPMMTGPYYTLRHLWEALDEADVVVTFNGKKFDIPRLNSAFKEAGFDAPSPYQQVDLYQLIRKTFYWPSMKLDEICKILLGDQKRGHEGLNLWIRCMNGDPDAWRIFQEYNEKDVLLTEELYLDIRGWLPNQPNALLYDENPEIRGCPTCGSGSFQRRGTRQLATGTYQQYQCNDCRSWFREVKRINGSTVR